MVMTLPPRAVAREAPAGRSHTRHDPSPPQIERGHAVHDRLDTGSAGEYYWAGAAGTGFYVDPKEELICILMTQAAPGVPRR